MDGSEFTNGTVRLSRVTPNPLIIAQSSGDTGVSASLIFHGTPPFQVYYRTQRDKEDPRDLFKTFTTSRGELTLQPEHSGHYFYTFLHLSDANYKKVELKGPSIDQIVHPLAAADFVPTAGNGRSKRMVNSCSGNMVDIEVDLRVSRYIIFTESLVKYCPQGTAPWNLELDIVGPRSTDRLEINDVKSSPTRIQVPIPSKIDKEGGTFEVDLGKPSRVLQPSCHSSRLIVSVEDSYGCKRSISVPGVSVNVRRVKVCCWFLSSTGYF